MELEENNEDLIAYMDAIQRSDSDKWLDAIKSEIESIEIIGVWILVDPSKEVRPIGYK